MSDDDRIIFGGEVFSLADYRERLASPSAAPEPEPEGNEATLIEATSDGKVRVRIGYVGGATATLICEPETAEHLARRLRKAVRTANAIAANEICRDCGEEWCNRWHVGQQVEGWRNGVKVTAYVAKLTVTSVRLEPVDGSAAFYRSRGSRSSWCLVGRGRGRLVSVR
jgi:hypothetical protein